jgi:uncharacterized protein involved in outer membrane biogenesis
MFWRWFKWPLLVLGGLVALLLAAITSTAALVDAGYLHEPIRKLLVARTRREIGILGPVQVHLLSLHPSMTAERVIIQNPPWMPEGILAEIGKVSFELETPTLAEPLRFRRIELQAAVFHLLRDAAGKANWRSTPDRMGSRGPPLMGSLSMPGAEVHLRDARRHLAFDGTVTALGAGYEDLQIEASGELNTRPMKLSLTADPLARARRDRPYSFHFEEHSSGSTVSGSGELARPFDPRELQASLQAEGNDLKDLYYLIGVNFPDTGAYHLAGQMHRAGLRFDFAQVQGTSGKSDIAGTVGVDSTAGRTQVTADLQSARLRRADLGKQAAGRASPRAAGQPLLGDAPLQLDNLRRTDWTINYRAGAVDLDKLHLNTLAMRIVVDHGVLTAAPVSAKFIDGSVTGHWRFDGSNDVAAMDIALDFNGLQLGQFGNHPKRPAPLEGALRGRLQLGVKGRSMHELAASADGMIVAVLPQGSVRASLAELGGIDLRGLGLLLGRSNAMTPVRCGVVALEARAGLLTSQVMVLDTGPVLVTGAGTLDLSSEALDFQFRGHPKHVRLRLRAPLLVRGTLALPQFGPAKGKPLAQAGAGVALGVLLTPLAAIAMFIDPGRAQDADCATLIATSGG